MEAGETQARRASERLELSVRNGVLFTHSPYTHSPFPHELIVDRPLLGVALLSCPPPWRRRLPSVSVWNCRRRFAVCSPAAVLSSPLPAPLVCQTSACLLRCRGLNPCCKACLDENSVAWVASPLHHRLHSNNLSPSSPLNSFWADLEVACQQRGCKAAAMRGASLLLRHAARLSLSEQTLALLCDRSLAASHAGQAVNPLQWCRLAMPAASLQIGGQVSENRFGGEQQSPFPWPPLARQTSRRHCHCLLWQGAASWGG